MTLNDLGWSPKWRAVWEEHCCRAAPGPSRQTAFVPARITREERESYRVLAAASAPAGADFSAPLTEQRARISGRLRGRAGGRADFPAVGDWVLLEPARGGGVAYIHAILPRTSRFARKAIGEAGDEQIVAANVDTVLVVSGLDRDFNIRRLERYLTQVWESGAAALLVLNKADLCAAAAARVADVEAVAFGTPVLAVSVLDGRGVAELRQRIEPGRTIALVGSSGVGKSSLINALLGEKQLPVGAVRDDDQRGRHTTTRRELVLLPGGGVLIDTPGMRELQLWGDEDALENSFAEIAALARECRFSDCAHDTEPGCRVRAALADGTLAPARFESFRKLQREMRYLARRDDVMLRLAEEARWKKLMRVGKDKARGRWRT